MKYEIWKYEIECVKRYLKIKLLKIIIFLGQNRKFKVREKLLIKLGSFDKLSFRIWTEINPKWEKGSHFEAEKRRLFIANGIKVKSVFQSRVRNNSEVSTFFLF